MTYWPPKRSRASSGLQILGQIVLQEGKDEDEKELQRGMLQKPDNGQKEWGQPKCKAVVAVKMPQMELKPQHDIDSFYLA
jgi:hypothetical protein